MFSRLNFAILLVFIFSTEARNLRSKRQNDVVVSASAGDSKVTGDENNIDGELTAAVNTMGEPTVDLLVSGYGKSDVSDTANVDTQAVAAIDFGAGKNTAVGSTSQVDSEGTATNVNSSAYAFIDGNKTVSHTYRTGEASGVGDVNVQSTGQNLIAVDSSVNPASNIVSNQEARASGSFASLGGLVAEQRLGMLGLNSTQVASAFGQGANSGNAAVNQMLERMNGNKIETSGTASGTAGELVNSGVNGAIQVSDESGTFESGVNAFGEAGGQGNSSLLTAAATNDGVMSAVVNGDANVEVADGESKTNGSNTVLLNNAGVAAEGTGDAVGNGTEHNIAIVNGILANDNNGETQVVGTNTLLGTGNLKSEAGASVDTVYSAGAGQTQIDSLGTAKSDNGAAGMTVESQGIYNSASVTNTGIAQSAGESTGDTAETFNHNFIKVDDQSASGSSESNSEATGATSASATSLAQLSLDGMFAGERVMSAGGEAGGSGTNVVAKSHSRADDFSGINNLISKHSVSAGGSGTSTLTLSGFINRPEKRRKRQASNDGATVEQFMHVCLTSDPSTCGWLVKTTNSVTKTETYRYMTLLDFMQVLYQHVQQVEQMGNGGTAKVVHYVSGGPGQSTVTHTADGGVRVSSSVRSG